MRMVKKIKILSVTVIAMLIMGMNLPMKKMTYTIVLEDRCEKNINNLLIKYDGENILHGGSRNIGRKGGGSYTMPMSIPKIATVSWEEEDGTAHQYNVPLQSKIKTTEIIGSDFTIVFSVCDANLTVYFDKDIGQFESKRRVLWSSDRSHDKA